MATIVMLLKYVNH